MKDFLAGLTNVVIEDEPLEMLEKAWTHGEMTKQTETLKHCLSSLNRIAINQNGHARIWPDFSPLGFSFGIFKKTPRGSECCFNGGIIYHGVHDGYGSGSAPTLSVCLNETHGWSLHT